tara:strand:+ start:177 stop:836 length:660 start_codon:yes stop_codon:yes gene_type:complete
MATIKKSKSPDILSTYMESVLEHEKFPLSVYKFCKNNEIEEKYFYKTYSSLDSVKHHVWQVFFENTIDLLHKNKNYESMTRKDRLLTFYFTFFEVLLLNRSYVLFSLNGNENLMNAIGQLKKLRFSFKEFATQLIEEGNDSKTLSLVKHPVGLFAEASWAQLLFVLKFWLEDTSSNFEKTDAAIEKSITVAFDVFDNTQIDSLFDFGKFLWKEKFIKAN